MPLTVRKLDRKQFTMNGHNCVVTDGMMYYNICLDYWENYGYGTWDGEQWKPAEAENN